MKAIPVTPLTLDIARRIIWFEPPDHALADPIRFMTYAMTYARHEDMRVIRRYVSDDDMRDALDHAPPGIIAPRSWAYWNSKMVRYPPPPLPVRRFSTDRQDPSSTRNPGPAQNINPEDQGQADGLVRREIRKLESPVIDLEEVRLRARGDWRKKYKDQN